MAESNLIRLCGAGEGRLQGDYPGIRGSKFEAFILCHWQKCVVWPSFISRLKGGMSGVYYVEGFNCLTFGFVANLRSEGQPRSP